MEEMLPLRHWLNESHMFLRTVSLWEIIDLKYFICWTLATVTYLADVYEYKSYEAGLKTETLIFYCLISYKTNWSNFGSFEWTLKEI